MKISCEINRDLYLLYENGEASEESRKLVEEHMAECDSCKNLFKSMNEGMVLQPDFTEDSNQETKILKNGLKKVKRRWRNSMLAVLLCIPLLGVTILSVNQYRGTGRCFTNIDDIYIAQTFVEQVAGGKMEEAIAMLDFTSDYGSIYDEIRMGNEKLTELYGKNPTKEEYVKARKENYLEYLSEFKEAGYKISNIHFIDAYWHENGKDGYWNIQIAFTENAPDGVSQNIIGDFSVREGKVDLGSAMWGEEMPAIIYALWFNNMWHLDRTPTYEEYLEME